MRPVAALAGLFVLMTVASPALAADTASAVTYGAGDKAMRGVCNTLTGWVEIPKRINETWQASGAGAGFTWGLLRGLGHGFIRTAAGLYELVTFPFPAPPGYEPVLQPEYVFDST